MNEWEDPHISHQRREGLMREVETQRLIKALRIRRRERARRRKDKRGHGSEVHNVAASREWARGHHVEPASRRNGGPYEL